MKKDRIIITVSGKAKIGKTTLALAIAKGLDELFDVDIDISCFGDSSIFDILMDDDEFKRRLNSMKDRVTICMEERGIDI